MSGVLESSRSCTRSRVTGICWSSSAASACLLHESVVEMIMRLEKPDVPDAVKNESMSPLAKVCGRCVELALDRRQRTGGPLLGHQIDPGVRLARRVWAERSGPG